MSGGRPTRDEAVGRLISRALTRPMNVLPAAAVVATGFATGMWPLAVAGLGIYGALAATTFASRDEARKAVGAAAQSPSTAGPQSAIPARWFGDPTVQALYNETAAEYARLREALANRDEPMPEVEVETRGLMDDVGTLCTRAQRVCEYLATVDPAELARRRDAAVRDQQRGSAELRQTLAETASTLERQLATISGLEARVVEFEARMRQIVSSVGAIRAEITAIDAEAGGQAEIVLRDVASARSYVTTLADAMDEGRRPQPSPG